MTGLLPFVQRYSPRGRWMFFTATAAGAYVELTDDDIGIADALAIGAVGAAGANLLTAGLESAIVGYVGTEVAKKAVVPAPYVAAAALGYVAGATAGTIIAEQTMGPDAGQMAYDLYTNPDIFSEGGIAYETADMLGNLETIISHYVDERFWENNAARPGDPDYQYSGHTQRYAEMYGYSLG